MNRLKKTAVYLAILLGGLGTQANAQPGSKSGLHNNAYSIVENAETEVIYNSPTDAVCRKKRTVTVLDEKGKEAASFYSAYNEKLSSLRKFQGIVTDANGNVLHKIKKSNLQSSEYSTELASDVFRYFYYYSPTKYPFTITYEWEEKYTDGLIGLPVFMPQQGYNQAVLHASYRLLTPADAPCQCRALNFTPAIDRQTTEEGKILTLIRADSLPAINNEPFSPPLSEILPHMYVVPETFRFGKSSGNMDSWKNYGLWQYSLLEGRDQLPQELIQKLKEMTAGCKTDRERIKTVYDYLAATTRYVSIQLGIGGLQPITAADVYRTGFGDCKGLSNYMRAMLSALGIPSVYTEISTKNKRFLPDFASANQGNHIILQVPLPKDTLWLECTNPRLPLGYVHHSIAGHDALLVTPEGGKLHRLPTYPDSLNIQTNLAKVTLTSDGQANIEISRYSRLFQYENELGLAEMPQNKQKDYLRSGISLVQAEVSNIRHDEQKQAIPSINTRYTVISRQYGNRTGKRMFLPANVLHRRFQVPNMSDTRTQDILADYGYTDIDSIEIQLPDNYCVESLPAPIRQVTAFGNFSSSIRTDGNKIYITHRLYNKRGRYPKEEYARFIKFRKDVAGQYNSKIIIKKEE